MMATYNTHKINDSNVLTNLQDWQSVFAYIHVHCEFLSSASYTYSLVSMLEGTGHTYTSFQFKGYGRLDNKHIY